MATTATTPPMTATQKSSSQIKRLAWIIVCVSFMLFCSLSIATTGGLYYFFVRSTVAMDVSMEVGRGSVGVTAIDYEQIRRYEPLPFFIDDRPSTLTTDTLSQTTLSFRTPSDQVQSETDIITNITLKNNSGITVQNARRPRFNWSDGIYSIALDDFSGEAEIFITEVSEQPIRLQVNTAFTEASFLFDTIGHYTITANDTLIRVVTHNGRALLISPNNMNNRFAIAGQQATLLNGSNLPIVTTIAENLIENGDFTFNMLAQGTDPLVPQRWGCFARLDEPPIGQYEPTAWQGRPAVRLFRDVGDASSQTGCSQILNQSVEAFSFLELRTTFAINEQSLVNCGIVGTECPMMIFIDYLDPTGEERTWYQGIFVNYDPQSPRPLVCQACAETYEHLPISPSVWYTFESGNIFARVPEEERPVEILDIEFYASGHRYDVFVSEIALLAGTEQVIPPMGNVPPE
ncbi:MAG: hypothetical protein AAFR81_13440 [Chloroflexota bacterium]